MTLGSHRFSVRAGRIPVAEINASALYQQEPVLHTSMESLEERRVGIHASSGRARAELVQVVEVPQANYPFY